MAHLLFANAEPSPFSAVADAKGRYRKEIVRTGEFDYDGKRLKITRDMLDHWKATYAAFREAGLNVPVTVGHSRDQNNIVGRIVGMDITTASVADGEDALVADIDLFESEPPRGDMSIYAPATTVKQSWRSGTGTTFEFPITHVALTDRPRIDGLAGFERIACSLVDDVAQPNGDSKVSKIKDYLANVFGKGDTPTDGADGGEPAGHDAPDKRIVALVCEQRQKRVESLCRAGKLSPAAGEHLLKALGTEQAVVLSLSLDDGDVDPFDLVCEVLEMNEPIELKRRSHAQLLAKALKLSGDTDRDRPTGGADGNDDTPRDITAGMAEYASSHRPEFKNDRAHLLHGG
jgi:hypothetical protein